MQHYTSKDKMLTIHADKLIPEWELKKSITDADALSVFDYTLNKCPCYDMDGREIPGLYHIERMDAGATCGEILPLGGFGDQYTILQNRDLYNMIARDILPELPGAKAKKATKASAAKPAADFEPVKLPAVFHSPDGSGELTITAASITYSQGLREVIFPARSAHYFARDYKAGERVIAAGSVGVKVGGKSLIFGPDAPAIVAAVRTAKAAADKAAKAAKI